MSSVDILVPCYGYGRFLRGCIESILSQSHDDFRVLILDDASPDETAEVASAFAAEDARVTVVRHAVNRGHIATYNEGLDWARGDYVLLLSADDLLAPGALRRAVAVMDAHPDVVLTYGDCVIVGPGELPPAMDEDSPADPPWEVLSGEAFIAAACRIGDNFVPTPTAIARTSVQRRIGGYRPELHHAGDMEMWLRFAANGAVARTTAVQAVKREHGGNMSVGISTNLLTVFDQRRATFDSFFREYGRTIPSSESLRREAFQALAEKAFWHSVGKLVEGRTAAARDLWRFAMSLHPELRFRPPLGRLLDTPGLHRKVRSTLGGLAANLARRIG